MTPPATALTESITRQLDQLSAHLSQAGPQQAAQILKQVLDAEDGILGRLTALVGTGTYVTKHHAQRGVFPAEMWLALGRTANTLHDLALDLDERQEVFEEITSRHSLTTASPAATQANPLVARGRHR
ncbi:hypothetical protein [Streptomyces sp. WAC06614]|uniref:hypothetical protein n=1 Tax=Streptomyces sp. WAC06614 TaxID=2487416 RepID=UPI000F77013E|nr:hypothetical protein [Streptomyces sp. WAC06614]RSS81747.1 hypothetical protein EF918_09335 [Streptomyces sp. WAC06614]